MKRNKVLTTTLLTTTHDVSTVWLIFPPSDIPGRDLQSANQIALRASTFPPRIKSLNGISSAWAEGWLIDI